MRGQNMILGLLVAVVLGVGLSAFTVYESEEAMVYMFQLVRETDSDKVKVYKPGLHFRVPMISNVLRFDMRERILDIKTERITTKEKKDVYVNLFVVWKIEDLELYYTRAVADLRYSNSAEDLLEQKVISVLKAEIGQRDISELVSEDRLELMYKLRQSADQSAHEMGIKITDARIKRIDLPDNVSNSVYERMRSERKQEASQIRATGRAQAIDIRAQADNKQRVIIAEAARMSNEIKGQGDAQATSIYADAYNKDPDFFKFYRSLEAYQDSFTGNNDLLVISPKGEFFSYLDSSSVGKR